ncbi:MAG: class I SAM-dependent methyltransferase [Phycisphaerales bacterium]
MHYRPLDLGSLSRRLTGAPGYADFAVTFPTGERMRIRATRDRAFADLLAETSGYPLRWLIDALPPLVRPGDRAIILGAGTGAITRAVADLVGPSGSVTALDPDAVSVAYARKRYPAEHIAHERGTHRSLDAEPDHAAEVILLTPLAAACPLEELWRILSPRGRLIAAAHHAGRLKALAADADIRILQLPHHAQTATPGEDRRIGVASRTPGA